MLGIAEIEGLLESLLDMQIEHHKLTMFQTQMRPLYHPTLEGCSLYTGFRLQTQLHLQAASPQHQNSLETDIIWTGTMEVDRTMIVRQTNGKH